MQDPDVHIGLRRDRRASIIDLFYVARLDAGRAQRGQQPEKACFRKARLQ